MNEVRCLAEELQNASMGLWWHHLKEFAVIASQLIDAPAVELGEQGFLWDEDSIPSNRDQWGRNSLATVQWFIREPLPKHSPHLPERFSPENHPLLMVKSRKQRDDRWQRDRTRLFELYVKPVVELLERSKQAGSTQSEQETTTEPDNRFGYPQKDATIGILTALPKECAAVRLMLENEVRWKANGEGGARDYYLGEIPAEGGGSHQVAVALLPDMGNNSAAIRATLLLQHFPEVRHIIMCGIAGGVPNPGDPEHDIRLGDIVVSNRNGVVQYDLNKEGPDGMKEHRHPPRPPDAELLSAVRHLLVEEQIGNRPWEALLARGAKLKNSSRPADNLDARGQRTDLLENKERMPGLPHVFHAPIAAANILLKNPQYRNHLSNTFGVKAIEMEGSGIADATWTDGSGYLVVRGICDFCDANKGDLWQGAAAVAAAAYVRALIASMPANRETTSQNPQ